MQEIIRKKAVLARTGMSNTTLYARIAEGKFPKQIPLGSARIVGWLASDIDTWIDEQVRAARGETMRASA